MGVAGFPAVGNGTVLRELLSAVVAGRVSAPG
jgi:hypothetical protein